MAQRFFRMGDRVRIVSGSLAGCEGYVDSITYYLADSAVNCSYNLRPVDILDDGYDELVTREFWFDFELEPVVSVDIDTDGIEVLI